MLERRAVVALWRLKKGVHGDGVVGALPEAIKHIEKNLRGASKQKNKNGKGINTSKKIFAKSSLQAKNAWNEN